MIHRTAAGHTAHNANVMVADTLLIHLFSRILVTSDDDGRCIAPQHYKAVSRPYSRLKQRFFKRQIIRRIVLVIDNICKLHCITSFL